MEKWFLAKFKQHSFGLFHFMRFIWPHSDSDAWLFAIRIECVCVCASSICVDASSPLATIIIISIFRRQKEYSNSSHKFNSSPAAARSTPCTSIPSADKPTTHYPNDKIIKTFISDDWCIYLYIPQASPRVRQCVCACVCDRIVFVCVFIDRIRISTQSAYTSFRLSSFVWRAQFEELSFIRRAATKWPSIWRCYFWFHFYSLFSL